MANTTEMNEAKCRAAYLLSDEIYGAFHSAQLADRLLGSMLDFRLDDEEVDETDQYTLRATFKEIVWRMDILSRYLSEARGDLHLLDTAAREYIPDKTGVKADSPKACLKSDDEILARVKELTADLDTAAQQRVLEIFGEKTHEDRAGFEEVQRNGI